MISSFGQKISSLLFSEGCKRFLYFTRLFF